MSDRILRNMQCVPSNQAIQATGQGQVSQARTQAMADLDKIDREWDAEVTRIQAESTARLFFPLCDERVPPGAKCGMVWDTYKIPEFQETFARSYCAPSPNGPDSECANRFTAAFLQDVERTYAVQPAVACEQARCDSYVNAELAVIKKHNEIEFERRRDLLRQVNASYKAQADAVVARFGQDVSAIQRDVAVRVEDAERRRAALQAVGAGLRAAGDSLSASSGPSAVNAPECSSDFQCKYGQRCVKDSGAFRGICATSVNRAGTPSFEPPRSNSVGPGKGECSFDTQCPVGFRCVKTSGGLRGNCLK